jgi:hypothetical protein
VPALRPLRCGCGLGVNRRFSANVLNGEDKRDAAGRNKRHERHDHSADRCDSYDVRPSAGTLAPQHYTAFFSEVGTGECRKWRQSYSRGGRQTDYKLRYVNFSDPQCL